MDCVPFNSQFNSPFSQELPSPAMKLFTMASYGHWPSTPRLIAMIEGVSSLDVDVLNRAGGVGHCGLQQVAVIHRQLVGALGAPDQISNDVVSLGRNVAAEEGADSAGARNAPGEVQSYAPEKLRIIRERGMRECRPGCILPKIKSSM